MAKSRWRLTWHGDEIENEIQRARKDVLRESAGVVMDGAKEDVPVRSGALLRSARIDVFPSHAIVSFGMSGKDPAGRSVSKYAIMNHVREDYKHRHGRVWYLRAQFANPRKAFEKMADKIRHVIMRG